MINWGAAEWFVSRLILTAGCLVVAVKLTSISSSPAVETSIETAMAELVTTAEVDAHKAKLLDVVARPSGRCKRPVLRGTASPGTAAVDVMALDANDTPIGRCLTEWRAIDSFTQRTPEKLRVLEHCGATLEAGLRAAIQHEDACSPYGLGGPEPVEMSSVLYVGQILGERARVMADAGDVQGALWLLLELARFGQDHGRGRTAMLAAMLQTAVVDQAVEHATAILKSGKPSNIDELATAVDALLASEPSFGEAVGSDPYRVALDFGLPAFESASWVPPGGWRKDQLRPNTLDDKARDSARMMLVFGSVNGAKIAQACPVDASLAACRRGFLRSIDATSSDGSARSLILQALVESQTGQYLAVWPPYVDKRATSHGGLIALRLQLEVLRKGCADRAALAKLATTPTLGDVMRLSYTADSVTVRPPAWVASEEPITIHCDR